MKIKITPLKTKRILLREIIHSDLNNVYRGLSNPNVIKYYGINFNSLEDTKEQMEWFDKEEQCWWAICSPDNNEFYGAGGLNDINHHTKKAEIGLWLHPEYWGKGYMAEALPLITTYAFQQLNLERIEGFVESENLNCKKVMAKLGFKLENSMQNCEIKNDKFINIDVYVKTLKNKNYAGI